MTTSSFEYAIVFIFKQIIFTTLKQTMRHDTIMFIDRSDDIEYFR